MRKRRENGSSLIEVLASAAILIMATSGLSVMLVQNGRMNKSKRMAAEVQSSARNCLEMVVARLRSAGWDPGNNGINAINLDPDLSDTVSQIEVFADLNGDGDTGDADEQTLIRHSGTVIEWRPSASGSFVVLAPGITNDADGDGTLEPMFQPDSTTDPTRITVQITAESPLPDPVTGQALRYTLSSDVLLRKLL
jgi:Tfp pilus assembly protein PilW